MALPNFEFVILLTQILEFVKKVLCTHSSQMNRFILKEQLDFDPLPVGDGDNVLFYPQGSDGGTKWENGNWLIIPSLRNHRRNSIVITAIELFHCQDVMTGTFTSNF